MSLAQARHALQWSYVGVRVWKSDAGVVFALAPVLMIELALERRAA